MARQQVTGVVQSILRAEPFEALGADGLARHTPLGQGGDASESQGRYTLKDISRHHAMQQARLQARQDLERQELHHMHHQRFEQNLPRRPRGTRRQTLFHEAKYIVGATRRRSCHRHQVGFPNHTNTPP